MWKGIRGDLLVLLFCSLVALLPVVCHGADMPLGSTLSPGNSAAAWSSPNSTFSLSFTASPSSPSLFVASLTYAGGVPVWSAGSGAAVDSGGSLRLTSTGDLQLVNGSGAVVWSSNTGGRGVSSAAVQESGNLVLKNATTTLWQSFDHPTDTVVMSQNFTSGMNLTSGSYVFTVDRGTGNLTLRWAQAGTTVTYFNKGYNSTFTGNRTLSAPTLTMQTNGIVSLTDGSLSSPVVVAYSSNYGESGDMMRFVRLDSDGNFRAYSATRGSNSATEQWSAVADQCQVFGFCGNMGVCSYNGTSPVCGCPSLNFVFNNPSNPREGCKRTVDLQSCPGNSTMLALDNTQFLTYPPEITTEQFFVGITACRLNCLSGSSCVASTALSDGSGLCFLKVSSFVSAYQSAALPSTSFVKVCFPGRSNPTTTGGSGSTGLPRGTVRGWVVVIVVLGAVAGLVLCEWALWWFFCRHSPKYGPASAQYALLEYASGAPVQFSFRELQRSTKSFKEKLGAGGFGAVYRGVLANRTVVAVKQLEGIEQGEKQFRMEVATISSTHHLNLVRLIGFCSEGRHRLLVYEFMKNGSLDAFLFGDAPPGGKLPWPARFAVAVGTARGITYLHEECRDCIVHCDIKPENILLDDQYNAKVSDFGLAKLVNPKDHRHRTLTSVRGTRGYLAPEWLANLPITAKSDVYSYGMVLLEIVSGHRNFDISEETGRKKFSVWAYEEYDKGNVADIIDKKLPPGEDIDMAQVHRALQVSFWCIQEQPAQRPSMGKVVQMLEGIMELERPPPPKSSDSFLSSVTTASGSASGVTTSMVSTFASSAPVAPTPSPNLEREEIAALERSASVNRDRVSRAQRSTQPYMTM
ncbi:hypothetical protein QOZ80_3AG0209090 [Eleusine coracana subsp. coracana]|nr:hypothetical protein QOZ80_3AG0209090 [Eleusine coracana subsp. coracana]